MFLNLGGIANVSQNNADGYIAFDVCAANKILNMLIQKEGKEYDEDGKLLLQAQLIHSLLTELNSLEYYKQSYPKSLDNGFGVTR